MKLMGAVTSGQPLLVAALDSEVRFVETDWPILITGVGKVAAATAVAVAVTRSAPSVVVNVGTAGALREGLAGAHWVGRTIQHDFDSPTMRRLTGESFGGPIELRTPPGADPVRCATGDLFVEDPAVRDLLAAGAELCDMEGYAVAHAAVSCGIPVSMIKYVSDPADAGARLTWRESIDQAAREIAATVAQWSGEIRELGISHGGPEAEG